MAEEGRTYAGRSQADRRQERHERLLDAALSLIGEVGTSGLAVRAICARATLTPRYFYEEFGSLEALLEQLFDREFDAGLARVGPAALAAGAAVERVRAVVAAVLDLFEEEPARAALLLTEATGGGLLAARRTQRMDEVIAVVAGFGRSTYGAGAPEAPPTSAAELAAAERALRLAATFVAGGLAQVVDAWVRGELSGDRSAVEHALAAQIVAVGDAAAASLGAASRQI